jgi:hypothetical protein
MDPKNQKTNAIPSEIKKWNWGAFLLNWIWGLFNKTYIALLCFVPLVNIVMIFLLGAKGNEWAWKNKQWRSIEHFKKVQKKWKVAGISLFIGVIVLPLIVLLTIHVIYPYFDAQIYNSSHSSFIKKEHIRVELEIDMKSFVENLAHTKDDDLDRILFDAEKEAQEKNKDYLTVLLEKVEEQYFPLRRYYFGRGQNFIEY